MKNFVLLSNIGPNIGFFSRMKKSTSSWIFLLDFFHFCQQVDQYWTTRLVPILECMKQSKRTGYMCVIYIHIYIYIYIYIYHETPQNENEQREKKQQQQKKGNESLFAAVALKIEEDEKKTKKKTEEEKTSIASSLPSRWMVRNRKM